MCITLHLWYFNRPDVFLYSLMVINLYKVQSLYGIIQCDVMRNIWPGVDLSLSCCGSVMEEILNMIHISALD